MRYVQSPSGTVHQYPKGSNRTKCGIRIGEGWRARDSKPNPLSLANNCGRCERSSDRPHGLRVKRPDARGERREAKIREMQEQCSDTDPIG